MKILGPFTKKLAFTSLIALCLSIPIPTAAFPQQTDQSQKPSGVSSHKPPHRPPPQPVPFWYYESERQYQEPPSVIIPMENTTETPAEKKETPPEPQNTGPLIIERKGNTYERIDNSPPIPKKPAEETTKITPDPGTGRTCPTCKRK